MQDTKRRSNKDRSESTRGALIQAARNLFVSRSYAEIGTPELVAAAGMTRGALYHHFADKQALFHAVVEAESALVASEVEQAAPTDLPPVEALIAGSNAYLDAMGVPGRTRLLLLDAPAVLGRSETDAIDVRHAGRTLREGLEAGMAAGVLERYPLATLTAAFSAMFDRAAMAIDAGEDANEWRQTLARLITSIVRRTS